MRCGWWFDPDDIVVKVQYERIHEDIVTVDCAETFKRSPMFFVLCLSSIRHVAPDPGIKRKKTST